MRDGLREEMGVRAGVELGYLRTVRNEGVFEDERERGALFQVRWARVTEAVRREEKLRRLSIFVRKINEII